VNWFEKRCRQHFIGWPEICTTRVLPTGVVAALLITSMAMVAERFRPSAETERPRMRVATPAFCVF
jgi:hypothetical protein